MAGGRGASTAVGDKAAAAAVPEESGVFRESPTTGSSLESPPPGGNTMAEVAHHTPGRNDTHAVGRKKSPQTPVTSKSVLGSALKTPDSGVNQNEEKEGG
eukprot:CAMPEP_0197578118 /NCGR_PEP_ID=MMETSP1326-20131121/2479_1 /TAXON_ID=1155430 /ORGANISM="Genus nov. species nov., Strain RCC2288" /LENGTH=99 /DNA_ID=CAMNT_0043141277 /DNA_START=100 /DNA_END=396 /DNA_ORIENTATION=+